MGFVFWCFKFFNKVPRVAVLDENLIEVGSFLLLGLLRVAIGFNSAEESLNAADFMSDKVVTFVIEFLVRVNLLSVHIPVFVSCRHLFG